MTVPDRPETNPGTPPAPEPPRLRLLILGGGGMLGHKLWQRAQPRADAWTTVRDAAPLVRHPELNVPGRIIDGVDAERFDTVDAVIAQIRPDVIVNAIGLIKQRREAQDPIAAIRVNALFPHLLSRAAAASGARLIHLSTDCVFDGVAGGYRESDPPNASDLYGRSKALGEVDAPGALTIRTSMIGRELTGSSGLLEWFLGQRGGQVAGFTHAIFSGLTTPVFADLILDIAERHPSLSGVYHVGADPIDKDRLLRLVNEAFDTAITIVPSPSPRLDRSLDGARFRTATGFVAPSWETMIAGLAADAAPYDRWRSEHAADTRR